MADSEREFRDKRRSQRVHISNKLVNSKRNEKITTNWEQVDTRDFLPAVTKLQLTSDIMEELCKSQEIIGTDFQKYRSNF